MQYRKKPAVIEAMNNNRHEGTQERIVAWAAEHGTSIIPCPSGALSIPTLEGEMLANIGDWIIKGVSNEFYPCKPDIFDKTYEPVSSCSAREVTNTEKADKGWDGDCG